MAMLIKRLLVIRAALNEEGLGWPIPLVWRAARLVLPVRLTGIGGPAHRLNLSIIGHQPNGSNMRSSRMPPV
jgi:hypothetical protein